MTMWTVENLDCRIFLRNLRGKIPRGSTHIGDPPFGERTHVGRRTGSETRRANIPYAPLTPLLATDVMFELTKLELQFIVLFADDETAQWWKLLAAEMGYYPFAPVPWVKPDAAPRTSADGPASGTEHIVVAAAEAPDPPVEWISIARWPHWPEQRFSRPPWYSDATSSTRGNHKAPTRPGTKPLSLMRKLVRDYAPAAGGWVLDAFCGTGPTLVAAREAGLPAVGCDIDAAVLDKVRADLDALDNTPLLPAVVQASQLRMEGT